MQNNQRFQQQRPPRVSAQLPQVRANHQHQQPHQQPHQQHQSGSTPSVEQQSSRGRPREQVPEAIPSNQVGLTEEQRGQIQRYIQLDDQIADLNTRISQLRKERKELEDIVLTIVQPLPAPIKSGNAVLRAKKKAVKESINQKFWVKKLAESGELRDPARADALVKHIYKNRESTEDYELIRE